MLTKYLDGAMTHAEYEMLEEDDVFCGSIPGFPGVLVSAPTLEACRSELREVLEAWLVFRLSRKMTVPEVDGIDLTFRMVS